MFPFSNVLSGRMICVAQTLKEHRDMQCMLRAVSLLSESDEQWVIQRNVLGKPEVWQCGAKCSHLLVSNTHDGGMHIAAAYRSTSAVGLGIDAVWLPRLRQRGKEKRYLLKLAARIAAPREFMHLEEKAACESTEQFRQRVAAHFSLKESVSKALGTGLKLGIGYGFSESISPRQIEVIDKGLDIRLPAERGIQQCELLGQVICWNGFMVSAVVWGTSLLCENQPGNNVS